MIKLNAFGFSEVRRKSILYLTSAEPLINEIGQPWKEYDLAWKCLDTFRQQNQGSILFYFYHSCWNRLVTTQLLLPVIAKVKDGNSGATATSAQSFGGGQFNLTLLEFWPLSLMMVKYFSGARCIIKLYMFTGCCA